MSADTDYARVLEMLTKQHLAPFVAYDALDRVNGLGSDTQHDHIVVRVSDGKIVAGSSHFSIGNDSDVAKSAEQSNPVSRPLFDPTCYRATGERAATFEGREALAIDLAATCKDTHPSEHDHPFTTLYIDPHTMQPLDVNGSLPDSADSKMVSVSMDERFASVSGRVLPSSIKVDISGSGLMFWLQVHVTESYSNYQFLGSYGG
jgi:hypothetical protein